MPTDSKTLCQKLIIARQQHPAWKLLASKRAALVLSALNPLFENHPNGIIFEDTLQTLADIFSQHAHHSDFDLGENDPLSVANKELRKWIKDGLVIERDSLIFASSALQHALMFVNGLDSPMMTSTASRLATVQREIENLESQLNPDKRSRALHIQRKITALKEELAAVNAGEFEVLGGAKAVEGIREVFALSTSLRADFRRVEDSYREADRQLRQSIIGDNHHRGDIVEKLLNSHDQLLETVEGQVFHGFFEQLRRSAELESMKYRLRAILKDPATPRALTKKQQLELRGLVGNLVSESKNVMRARARSERDVKGFLRSGLAAEHHRVGALINSLLEVALDIDWSRAAVRRQASPLPPVAPSLGGLPIPERLRFAELKTDDNAALALQTQHAKLDDVDIEFWQAFDGLDRETLYQDTLSVLEDAPTGLSLAQLSQKLPPTHDLETLTVWLSLAREAGLSLGETVEILDLETEDQLWLRFRVPQVTLTAKALKSIHWERLE